MRRKVRLSLVVEVKRMHLFKPRLGEEPPENLQPELTQDGKATKGVVDSTQYQVQGHNIVTVKMPQTRNIETYTPSKLPNNKGIKYSEVQKKFSTPKTLEEAKKNSRFRLNDLVRSALSVEEEEQEKIQNEVKKRLEQEITAIRSQVTKDAYQEGLTTGKKDAQKEILASAKPMLDTFQKLLLELEGMKYSAFKSNEDFLIRLIYRVAKAVILREIKEDKDYIVRLVTQMLERIGTRENIKIFLGSEVYSAATTLKEDLAQTLGQLKNITIELDPKVQGQGCFIETEFGEIDATIEVQLQNIAQSLGVTTP